LKEKGSKIFIADEIDLAGIMLLQKKGFDVIKVYGLGNPGLIKFISHFKSVKSNQKNSALIIRTVRKLTKKDIQAIYNQTDIKLLCAASSGYDNIDLTAAKKLGFDVLNVPDATFIPAAEHTIALLLAITKNIIPSNSDMKSGVFDFKRYSNSELLGKTIGIIGVGRVGSYVAKIAKSFGMNILGNDINKKLSKKYPWIKFVSLDRIISDSDVITVHTPFDESTKNLINSGNILKARKNAVFLNCARGGIINEKALLQALKSKKIAYAGIDVFTSEPLFDKEFKKLNNAVITPHLAGKTRESKARVSLHMAQRIIDYYSGSASIR
jgi:D-3-phosphoglycerate dehydrogenase